MVASRSLFDSEPFTRGKTDFTMKTLPAVAVALAVGLLPLIAEDKPQAAHKPDEAVAHVNNQTLTWGELAKAVAALKKQFTSYGRNVTDEQLPPLRYDVLQQ